MIATKSSENRANLKNLRVTIINANNMHEEIKSRLNSWNGCFYLVQELCLPV
jgi:hypothetical protein